MNNTRETELNNLAYSDEYANFIMDNASDRVICNGDTLLGAMEDGYLFEEFLTSIGFEQ